MKFFVFLALVSSIISLSACDAFLQHIGERKYEEHADMASALEARSTERGWLPEWLPSEMTNIHLYYDLDTNERAISFRLPDSETFEWFPECVAEEASTRPRLKTRLFPSTPHKMDGVQDCVELYAVRDSSGIIHMWTKPGND